MYHLNPPQTTVFPVISDELLDALDTMFPERCPDPHADERRIWIEVGKREVVRYLRTVQAEQTRNILDEST